jgi:hypothetical protein
MKRSPVVSVLILLIVGIGGFVRFSQNTRGADAVGLFASGAVSGIALVRLIGSRRT